MLNQSFKQLKRKFAETQIIQIEQTNQLLNKLVINDHQFSNFFLFQQIPLSLYLHFGSFPLSIPICSSASTSINCTSIWSPEPCNTFWPVSMPLLKITESISPEEILFPQLECLALDILWK